MPATAGSTGEQDPSSVKWGLQRPLKRSDVQRRVSNVAMGVFWGKAFAGVVAMARRVAARRVWKYIFLGELVVVV